MGYFLALFAIIIFSRILCGSLQKTIVLPWIIVTLPMLCGAGLANLGLIPALIAPWSDSTHVLVICGTMALFAGSFSLQNIRGELTVSESDIHWNEQMLIKVLLFFTGIALCANATQFLIAGKIPLFSADPDHARIEAAKNGYIHVFSVLSGHIIPVSALILFTGKQLCNRTRKTLLVIITINSALLLLWVARGLLIYPMLTVIAMDYILNPKSFRLKKILAVAVICLVIVSGVKYMRDVTRSAGLGKTSVMQAKLTGFQQNLLGSSAVLYLTVALNYEILNRYVSTVPLLAPHSHGRIMAGNLTAYIPGSGAPYSELDFQSTVLKKFERDFTLTSTFFGIPYLDFGLPGVVVISFLVGMLYKLIWLRMIKTGSLWSIFLYGYLISMATFIPYTFLFTQVSFTWFLLSSFPIIFLCSCRVKSASIYYQNSRIRFSPTKAD